MNTKIWFLVLAACLVGGCAGTRDVTQDVVAEKARLAAAFPNASEEWLNHAALEIVRDQMVAEQAQRARIGAAISQGAHEFGETVQRASYYNQPPVIYQAPSLPQMQIGGDSYRVTPNFIPSNQPITNPT
jgi:hypothetical protein